VKRAERRHQTERIKERVKNRALHASRMDRQHVTPAWIGKTAAMHWTCPCGMCTTSLKWRKPIVRHIDDWNIA
jgi:hypothetical protein